jgi:hypothetical protein
MNQDPEVMTYMQGLQSPEVSNGFIDKVEAHWDEHGWGLWALEVPGVAPAWTRSCRSPSSTTPDREVMERIGLEYVEGGDFDLPNVERGRLPAHRATRPVPPRPADLGDTPDPRLRPQRDASAASRNPSRPSSA